MEKLTRLTALALTILGLFNLSAFAFSITITNFDSTGRQVVRFDTEGNAIDAHDGGVSFFPSTGKYYLYGTSYGCGFRWGVVGTSFCGFNAYSSTDLKHWKFEGKLFDPNAPPWQERCSGPAFGCFRPHVIYNAANQNYVLWVNDPSAANSLRVLTSKSPTSGFVEQAVPTLATLKIGDENVFVDPDTGDAYITYTNGGAGGYVEVVEKLDPNYTNGTGQYTVIEDTDTEAPTLFKRGANYYLIYSPVCPYCNATPAKYVMTGSNPLSGWSSPETISPNSCGGQPSFVAPIPLSDGMAYLFGSDEWISEWDYTASPFQGWLGQAQANQFWGLLDFNTDGTIKPLNCDPAVTLNLKYGSAGAQDFISGLDQNNGVDGFFLNPDIGLYGGYPVQRLQTFVPSVSGTLINVGIVAFKQQHYGDFGGGPTNPLEVSIVNVSGGVPAGAPLASHQFQPGEAGWSARVMAFDPDIQVTKNTSYGIVVNTSESWGYYGLAMNFSNVYPIGLERPYVYSFWRPIDVDASFNFFTSIDGGSGMVTVPVNLVGQSQSAATSSLTAAGLIANIVLKSSSTVAAGNVISANPASGSTVSVGSSVILTISTGANSGGIPTNYALSGNGGSATASSTINNNYPTSAVIDGDRKGKNWGSGGGWNDTSYNSYPDWVQVDLTGTRSINGIDVYTLADEFPLASEPDAATSSAIYGIADFQVQYWNGASWQTVPGGNVTGNNKSRRTFSFAAVSTSKVRVFITAAAGYSRVVELEAWGFSDIVGDPTPGNVALASAGAIASGPSYNLNYPASAAIDGDRKGLNWGAGGGWNDASENSFPDNLEIQFNGSKTISEIDVFTLQDNYSSPVDPTPSMSFSLYGVTEFSIQYWNGLTWIDVPGASVSSNNKVWRQFTFSPLSTMKIRIHVTGAMAGYSRIAEIEVLGH